MRKDPFVVLGLDKGATQSEVQSAYESLREEYRSRIHIEGDEGKKAAKKLAEIEDAYQDAMELLSKGSEVKDVYAHVAELLKKGDLDKAQAALDNVSERNAEWHYFQSAVYHSKGWNYEAKSQLEMAINMDPENKKYQETLERMKRHEEGGNTSDGARTNAGATNAGGQQRSYDSYDDYTRRRTASDCCTSLICADCCCECMGGDLIRCC
ncbi:MAG: hypothetical protein J6U39_04735 [Clostridia bacterium]|nr:hypothetical protein [Clostridia bacterium]